jgi:hypothetical protein
MKILFEEHITKRKQPVNFNNGDLQIFEHEFERKIRDTHLLVLKNAFYIYDVIMKFGKSPRKYLSYSLVYPDIPFKTILKRILLFRRGYIKLEKGVWIADNWSPGHFHWLTDALPRLMASKRENELYPVLLPEHFKHLHYVTESLNLLGEVVIYFNIQKPIKISKLLLTSHTSDTGNYNRILINELRNTFLNKFKVKGDRKIFISRMNAPKRKIVNEIEVVGLLKEYGYEIHYFEEYNFEKQVELISQSKSLVGLHGSGLTNMLFMREGGAVLELRNQDDAQNNCYFSLASELNIHYFYQLNQGNTSDIKTVDITVDIEKLRGNVEMMENVV